MLNPVPVSTTQLMSHIHGAVKTKLIATFEMPFREQTDAVGIVKGADICIRFPVGFSEFDLFVTWRNSIFAVLVY